METKLSREAAQINERTAAAQRKICDTAAHQTVRRTGQRADATEPHRVLWADIAMAEWQDARDEANRKWEELRKSQSKLSETELADHLRRAQEDIVDPLDP